MKRLDYWCSTGVHHYKVIAEKKVFEGNHYYYVILQKLRCRECGFVEYMARQGFSGRVTVDDKRELDAMVEVE